MRLLYLASFFLICIPACVVAQGHVKNFALSTGALLRDDGRQLSIEKSSVYQLPGTTVFNDKQGEPVMYFDGFYVYTATQKKINRVPLSPLANHVINPVIVPHLTKEYTYWLFSGALSFYDAFNGEQPNAIYPSRILYHEVYANPSKNEYRIINSDKLLYDGDIRSVSIAYNKQENFYWVCGVQHSKGDFCAFKLTSCGLATPEPIRHHLGEVSKVFSVDPGEWVVFSPDQKRVYVNRDDYVTENIAFDIYDFDITTAKINLSHRFKRDDFMPFRGIVGSRISPTFSKNSQFIYCSGDADSYQVNLRDSSITSFSFDDFAIDDVFRTFDGRIYLSGEQNRRSGNIQFYEVKNLESDNPFVENVISVPAFHKADIGSHHNYVSNFPAFLYDSTYKKPPPVIVKKPVVDFVSTTCVSSAMELAQSVTDVDSTVWLVTYPNGGQISYNDLKIDLDADVPGEYVVSVINHKKCVTEGESFNFTRDPIPYIDVLGGNVQQKCQGDSKAIYLKSNVVNKWKGGEKTILVESEGVYSASITNTCGTEKVEIVVENEEVFIPNVITPNGDGANDTFRIIQAYPEEIFLQIYNRNGQQLFEGDNYQNDWPHEEVSDGLVYYLVKTTNQCAYKGWLQIIH